MADNDSGSSNQCQQAAPSATSSQTPSAPPKPVGSQNVVFKDNTDGDKTSASDSGSKGENS